MPFLLATTGMFIAMGEPTANLDQDSGRQKLYHDEPDWSTPIAWTSSEGSHMLTVRTAGEKPAITPGMQVEPDGLVISEWTSSTGRHGISFRAKAIRPAIAARGTRGTAGGEA
jgi:hypothetical protein